MGALEDHEFDALSDKVSAPDYELPDDAVIQPGTDESRAQAHAMLIEATRTPEHE